MIDKALKAIGRPVASSEISVTTARDSFSRSPEKTPSEILHRQRLGGDDAQLCHQRFEVDFRERTSRTFNDPGDEPGMGAQGEIDLGLRQRLPPEAGVAPQTRGRHPCPSLAAPPRRHTACPYQGRVVQGVS